MAASLCAHCRVIFYFGRGHCVFTRHRFDIDMARNTQLIMSCASTSGCELGGGESVAVSLGKIEN